MKHIFVFWINVVFLCNFHMNTLSAQETISLSGKWRIALDGNFKDWPDKTGESAGWYKRELPMNENLSLLNQIYFKNAPFSFNNYINLPGSTDEAGIGSILQPSPAFTPGLERKFLYDGAFWVQREVVIPSGWEGRKVVLYMERIPGASKVFWDEGQAGTDYGYAYPHTITIDTSVVPGKHRLTILVNKDDYRYEQTGHQIFNANGTSWNGITGKIELQAFNPVAHFNRIQVYPDISNGSIRLSVPVNCRIAEVKAKVRVSVFAPSEDSPQMVKEFDYRGSGISEIINLKKPVSFWNEFNPSLYRLKCELLLNGKLADEQSVTFGMRELTSGNGYFLVNGKRTVMRGTLDCGSFPLTGYPATTKDEWLRIMQTIKDYGLNMVRYHTWCPPEAAFEAADQLGLYLQPELCGRPYAELQRILETYGNHPSFCLLSFNNEAFSHNEETRKLLETARNTDPRHLYTCTSHPLSLTCTDDFYVSAWGSEKQESWPFYKKILGITWGGGDVVTSSRFNKAMPETASDFSNEISGINAPVMAHEMGQWAMFPELGEIDEYQKGVLRNTNYERIRNAVSNRGLQEEASDMALASGRFSALLYKEEIESVMRTPAYGGFQLLGLNDYQGQFISIVGVLNDLWKSKGIIEPHLHKQYCNAVVPLIRMKKRVWLSDETFSARLDITNVSSVQLNNISPEWNISDVDDNVIAKGKFPMINLPDTGLTVVGDIIFKLKSIKKPSALQLKVSIPGTAYANSWNIWVYPQIKGHFDKGEIYITGKLAQAEAWLSEGKKVLFTVDSTNDLNLREACFTTIFWNSIHKWPQKAHTMGLLCNPEHPVFNSFPTEMNSDWQWWDIAMHSRAMVLNDLPHELIPLISVTDSYIVNDKLGYMWEAKVGKGKLMVCSVDFDTAIDSRPASWQLLHSLIAYLNSPAFNPLVSLNSETLRNMFSGDN